MNDIRYEKARLVDILPQPNDVTCGPTCLHAVYSYYNEDIRLKQVIKEVKQFKDGGTLGVLLGTHALSRGYDVIIYTYNLHMFDPTWFQNGVDLVTKLDEQLVFKHTRKFTFATNAYKHFLLNGGQIRFKELTPSLIKKYVCGGIPILTGLSATYLYRSAREIPEYNIYHDVKGEPAGHFVVISDYLRNKRHAVISDPLNPNPISDTIQQYSVPVYRLINAIMLGIVTYDANLLIIQPK